MPRYGDLDKLLEEEQASEFVVGVRNGKPLLAACKNYLKMVIDNAPTADVAPVVHGRWIDMQDDDTTEGMWRCSACGDDRYFDFMVTNPIDCGCYYCSNCGAKMDGTQ